MNHKFCREIDGIYRLKIPLESIYTSVFLLETDASPLLVDCGKNDEDVDALILPALMAAGYQLRDVKALIITHAHGDHAGGLGRILALAPDIRVIKEVGSVCRGISTYPLAGHTEDSIGVFDKRTNTLLSGDGLQGAGVGRYPCYTKNPELYLKTLERIERDECVENILFSHAYEPWNSDSCLGRETVLECVMQCKKHAKR